jgi:hypothetical protein
MGIMSFEVLRTTGSPGAKTGSPGDGSDCTSCHAGAAQNATDWVSTTIPGTGYVAGTTYTITATATHTGAAKFGFELTAEDQSNAKTGTFVINGAGTQLVNNGKAVTHTSSGTSPSGDSRAWTMDWTAPAAGTGNVTFYAAFNAANGSGSDGDVIYLSSKAVTEDAGSGTWPVTVSGSRITLYPQPVISRMAFTMPDKLNAQIELLIYTTDGRLAHRMPAMASSGHVEVDLSGLGSGVYILKVHHEGTDYSGRFIKK